MKRIAFLQKPEQVAPMWAALVRYANEEQEGDDGIEGFFDVISKGLEWIGGVDHRKGESYEAAVRFCDDSSSHVEGLEGLADKFRPEIRNVLAWLCAPMKPKADTRRLEGFLWKYDSAMEVAAVPNPGFDPDSKNPMDRSMIVKMPTRIGSVMTGVCRFILDQVDRHDVYGESLEDAFPIAICDRPGCGRFFVVQRSGRAKFCSSNCRARVAKKNRPLEDKAEYMRKYRAARKAKEARKAKAAKKAKKAALYGTQLFRKGIF